VNLDHLQTVSNRAFIISISPFFQRLTFGELLVHYGFQVASLQILSNAIESVPLETVSVASLLNTGQHYDYEMSQAFFEDLAVFDSFLEKC